MAGHLALLVVCFALGFLGRRLRLLPPGTAPVLNRLVLFVALPALVLKEIHAISLPRPLLAAASMMALVFLAALTLFGTWSRVGLPRASAGALSLTGGLCNSAFMGLPMLEGLLGPKAVGVGVVVDQLGSFLTLSTLGVATAARFSGRGLKLSGLARRVVLFPPFIAFIAALLLRPVLFPESAAFVLDRLAALVSPLALLSVGFQLELGPLRGRGVPLSMGLLYKLLLAPAMVWGVLHLAGIRGLLLQVTVLQCGMAPMVTGGIVAAEYELDPPLASLMVGVGVLLSFITVPLLATLLR